MGQPVSGRLIPHHSQVHVSSDSVAIVSLLVSSLLIVRSSSPDKSVSVGHSQKTTMEPNTPGALATVLKEVSF